MGDIIVAASELLFSRNARYSGLSLRQSSCLNASSRLEEKKLKLMSKKTKMTHARTSKRVAIIAGKKLSDPNSTKTEKSLAGLALVNRALHKKRK
jgi:hypothetical protein